MPILKKILLAISSGIFLALPWATDNFFFSIFFALVPLLYLADDKDTNNYIYPFISFLIWNAIASWWISEANVIGSIVIIVSHSLLQAIVAILILQLIRIKKLAKHLILISVWLSFEYLNQFWDLAWPWLQLGNAFACSTKLIQWYQYTGVMGGSLWVLLCNIQIYKLIKTQSFDIKRISYACIIILAPIFVSLLILNKVEQKGVVKNITIIQPNIDPYIHKFDSSYIEINAKRFTKKLISAINDTTDYIIGPETVFVNSINENNINKNTYINQILNSANNKTQFIFGLETHLFKNHKTYYSYFDSINNKNRENFNSIIYISKNKQTQFYHKNKLVPIFEITPFGKYIDLLNFITINIGGYQGKYSPQNTQIAFYDQDKSEIIPILCFESVFSDYNSAKINNSNSFICITTNDGWWKNSNGYKYHYNFAKIRAIEMQRYVVRAANNGISAIINTKGEEIIKSNWWTEQTIGGKIRLYKNLSIFSITGNIIGKSAVLIFLLSLIFVKLDRF